MEKQVSHSSTHLPGKRERLHPPPPTQGGSFIPLSFRFLSILVPYHFMEIKHGPVIWSLICTVPIKFWKTTCGVDHAAFARLSQKVVFAFLNTELTKCRSTSGIFFKGTLNFRTLYLNHCIKANVNLRWHALWRNDNSAAYRHGLNIGYSWKLSFMLLSTPFSLTAPLNQTLGYYRLLRPPWNIKPTVWFLWFHVTTMSLVNDLKFYPLWAIHIPM